MDPVLNTKYRLLAREEIEERNNQRCVAREGEPSVRLKCPVKNMKPTLEHVEYMVHSGLDRLQDTIMKAIEPVLGQLGDTKAGLETVTDTTKGVVCQTKGTIGLHTDQGTMKYRSLLERVERLERASKQGEGTASATRAADPLLAKMEESIQLREEIRYISTVHEELGRAIQRENLSVPCAVSDLADRITDRCAEAEMQKLPATRAVIHLADRIKNRCAQMKLQKISATDALMDLAHSIVHRSTETEKLRDTNLREQDEDTAARGEGTAAPQGDRKREDGCGGQEGGEHKNRTQEGEDGLPPAL